MSNEKVFPITVDRSCRTLMTVLGAGRQDPCMTMTSSAVEVRMGWAFRASIPRANIASARSVRRDQLPRPFRLRVLRGVNYWPRTALVNGAGTGLVQITLHRPTWVRLGPLRAPMRRLVVSADEARGLVAELNLGANGTSPSNRPTQ